MHYAATRQAPRYYIRFEPSLHGRSIEGTRNLDEGDLDALAIQDQPRFSRVLAKTRTPAATCCCLARLGAIRFSAVESISQLKAHQHYLSRTSCSSLPGQVNVDGPHVVPLRLGA